MNPHHPRRGFAIVPSPRRTDLLEETRTVREEAVAKHSEIDLLVAALKEHIADLRDERDRLVDENTRLRVHLEDIRAAQEAASATRMLNTRTRGIRS